MIRVIADLCGQIECNAKTRDTLFKEVAITCIGFAGGAETGVLTHGPETLAVHLSVDTTCKRKFSRYAEIAIRLPIHKIFGATR